MRVELWPRVALTTVLFVLLLVAGHGDYRHDAVDALVAPHRYSLVDWELSNFLDKWVRKSVDLLPWRDELDRDARNDLVREFFSLGRELSELRHRLDHHTSTAKSHPDQGAESLQTAIARVEARRREILATVEEGVESEISAVLAAEGFESGIGLIFPPVDTVFTSSPGVLVLSPRDRIHRQSTLLLEPGMSDADKERIEAAYFRDKDLSALVERTGGVAVYPSVVSDQGDMRYALIITAHEWLHHWFFFRPLGRNFWSSPEMTTLNETAATLGGEEIGERALAAMTGQPVIGETRPGTSRPKPVPGAFNFSEAMRDTRLRTEELLADGKVEEAESYMEQRRLMLLEHGFRIRKINQAFFAFHGSYAASPASISPIHSQLVELRERSDTLGEFLHTVAGFGSYEEFLDYLGNDGG